MVKSRSVKALVDAIKKLLDDETLRIKMGETGKNDCRK